MDRAAFSIILSGGAGYCVDVLERICMYLPEAVGLSLSNGCLLSLSQHDGIHGNQVPGYAKLPTHFQF